MFKILFATDLHAKLLKPSTRLDPSFVDTISAKMNFILGLAKTVNMTIFGGDICDNPDPSNSVIIRLMKLLSESDCDVFSVIGNHDIFGYQQHSVGNSAMGILMEAGCLHRLDTVYNNGITIRGMHAFDKLDFSANPNARYNIVVAHKMITNASLPGAIPISELAKVNKVDLVLSGDMHSPHCIEHEGKTYINPGSITRMSIADRDRKPQVVIITIDDDYKMSYEFVDIPCVPGAEIFDISAYEANKEKESRAQDFVKSYASNVMSVKTEAYRIGAGLSDFMSKGSVPEHIRSTINTYYGAAEEALTKHDK
jgi:DNA repair protein SbcD/Mre11